MTRLYLPRRPGDPLVQADFTELLSRFDAEKAAHDHSGGPRGPRLGASSFDPNTDASVQRVDAQRWVIAGQDLAPLLKAPLRVSGGSITGDLQVAGALEVGGRLVLAPPPPRAQASSTTGTQQQQSRTATVLDPQPEGAGKNHRALGKFTELLGTVVELELPRPALLLIEFTSSYRGPSLYDLGAGVEFPPLSFPMVELIAQRGDRSVALGGDWDSLDWEGDPLDIDALLRSKAAERLWADTGVGGGFQFNSQPISGYVYGEGYLPLSRCVLAQAGAGKLRLSAWAWGHDRFHDSGLYATTLTELDDV